MANILINGFGYTGVEKISVPLTDGNGQAIFAETSDATAAASDIATGKTAYVNGDKVTGTAAAGGDNSLLNSIINRTATSLVLPEGLNQVGPEAFYRYSTLESVTFPESLTLIAGSAFANCTALTSLVIPSRVIRILSHAFYNCTGLTTVTFKSIPVLMTGNAFQGCTNITDIYVPWSQYNVRDAPWGAVNATIHFDTAV